MPEQNWCSASTGLAWVVAAHCVPEHHLVGGEQPPHSAGIRPDTLVEQRLVAAATLLERFYAQTKRLPAFLARLPVNSQLRS